MIGFFLNILEITVGISLLVLIMLLVLKLFGGKFTSKCRYILWTLVLLRLAIPFSLNILPAIIEVPLQPAIIEDEQQNEVENDPVQNYVPEETTPSQGDVGTTVTPGTVTPGIVDPGTYNPGTVTPGNPTYIPDNNPTNPSNPSTPTVEPDDPIINEPPTQQVIVPEPIPETPKGPISVLKVLEIVSVVYIIGAAVFFCWNMLSYLVYTRKILRSARVADAKTLAVFLSICDKESLKKVPTLLVSPAINSPAAFGIFNRKIVLPDISFTQNGLAGTLFHEVVHCKRGDLYIKVIELVARSLHWFNPISHIAAVRCEMEMEMSCDETVLSGCSDEARAAYGNVMLDIIRRCRRNRGALTTHFNPKKNSVKSRFANIINGSGSRRGKILIPICLVLCILAGTIVACTTGDNTPSEADQPENDDPKFITIVSNEKDLTFKEIVIPDAELKSIFRYNDRYSIVVIGEGESAAAKNLKLYIIDKSEGKLVADAKLVGEYMPMDIQYTDDSVIVYYSVREDDGFSVKSAYKVRYENDQLEVTTAATDKYPDRIAKIVSPDGQYIVYCVNDKLDGTGGIDIIYPDGTRKRAIKHLPYEKYGLQGYAIYSPRCFVDNTRFIYSSTNGIGLYDISTGGNITLVETGEYKGYADGCVYYARSKNYADSELWKCDLTGEKMQIASVKAADNLQVLDEKHTYSFKDGMWFVYHNTTVHGTGLGDNDSVTVSIYSEDMEKELAVMKYPYDSFFWHMMLMASGETVSAVIFDTTEPAIPETTAPEPETDAPVVEPTDYVNVLSNPGGLKLKNINIPKADRKAIFSFNDRYIIVVTANNSQNKDSNGTNLVKDLMLYLIDIEDGKMVGYRNLSGQYFPWSQRYTDDGVILSCEIRFDTGWELESAYLVTFDINGINVTETQFEEFPRYTSRIVSPDGQYIVYAVEDDLDEHGGIDVVYPDGSRKRVMEDLPFSEYGMQGCEYFTPQQFIDNTRFIYSSTTSIGIYDISTGNDTTLALNGDYLGYADGYIYYSLSKGYVQSELWKCDTSGEKTFIASLDENADVPQLNDSNTYYFHDGKWFEYHGVSANSSSWPKNGDFAKVTVYSEDMTEELAVLEYTFDSGLWHQTLFAFDNTINVLTYGDYKLSPSDETVNYNPGDYVNFTRVDGILNHNTIVLPKNNFIDTYEYDERYYLFVTYDIEKDAQSKPIRYTDFTIYLIDTTIASLVDSVTIGDLLYRPTQRHYVSAGLVLFDLQYDDVARQYNIPGAFKITVQNGRLNVVGASVDAFPHHDEKLVSPDGNWTIYHTTDDGYGHGGIDVMHRGLNMITRILTNVMEGDPGVTSLGGVTGYTPIQFIDNTKLLYHIGGWEWTKGYGIYDLATGEKTEFRNEYGALGYADGIIYLSKSSGYETVGWYADTLAGGELTMLASVNEAGDEAVFHVADPYSFKFGGTNWRTVYSVNSVAGALGKEQVEIELYSLDLLKHSPNEIKKPIAEISYDVSNAEIYAISHYSTETAVVFVEGYELPEKEQTAEPVVKVLENDNNYKVHTVYIPVKDYQYKVFEYGDGRWIYMTYDNVTDENGYNKAYTNIHLYLFDTFKGLITAECDIEGEYRLDTAGQDLNGGIILYDIYNEGDAQYVAGAFAVDYDPTNYKLTVEKVDVPVFPRYYGMLHGKIADGSKVTITRTTDGGWSHGGIDLIMQDGTTKRILTNVVLDDTNRGISLSDVSYYYPIGMYTNTKLVYGIGSYEGPDKGFGIYDLTTDQKEEYVHQNYVARMVEYGCIIYEEIRRTNEGYREPYRIWKRDHDGNNILLASTDVSDGVFHITDDLWYGALTGHTDNLIRFDTGNVREEEDFLAFNLSYTTATFYSPNNNMGNKLITIEYPKMNDYYDNIYCDSNRNFTVVVPIDPAAMPEEKPTTFTSVDEVLAVYGDEVYWLADRLYSAEQFKYVVESFLYPEKYRDTLSEEQYKALSAMGTKDPYITYDKTEKKFYVTFTVTGTPVGTLKVGENTCEIVANAYDLGVMCYDENQNYSTEARIAVHQYINAACSVDPDKMYGMPDETFDDAIFFTDYIVWRLEDLGVTPTRDAVIDYAKRCFGLENYSPRADQFDENGNHVQFGYGGIHPSYAVTSETEENGVGSVTVQFFNHSLGHILDRKVVYRLTKLPDGAWKFIEVVEVRDKAENSKITYSTTTADEFFDLIWNMKENGTIPSEPYDVKITGLSNPVVMHMVGDANLGSIEALGQIIPVADRNNPETVKSVYLYGNCGDKELFEYEGKLIFVDTFYDVGNTYIIYSDGYDVLRNNGYTSTNFYLNHKGELRYKTVHSGMGDMVVDGRLNWAIGYDDFYSEEGIVSFRGNQFSLVREKYLSMSDGYSLDKEFNEKYSGKTTGVIYESIEEIFEANKKKLAEVVKPIYIPAEDGDFGMIDSLWKLENRKELPKCPYDIYVTGLSVPFVIHMAGGQSLLSAEAYGIVQDMTNPNYPTSLFDGSTTPRVFEVGEYLVFNLSSGGYYGGPTYIFSKNGCNRVKSGSQASVYLFLDDNDNLKYRFSTRRTSDIQQIRLWTLTSRDEFYYSIGEAEIVNGEAVLSAPYEVYTVSDIFEDFDESFANSKEWGSFSDYETVDELFAANLKRELNERASTFSPENYLSDVNIHTGKEVLFWYQLGFNPVYLYFVPIENSAKEFTVYYTKNYGISLESLKLDFPAYITFDTAEPIWAGGGSGSGECRFVVKLTKGDEVAYIYYNNFHYETDILDFSYAGTVSTEDLEYFMETYPEIFGEIE